MRRVPVYTLASLVAVMSLVAAPVYSATLFGTDTPDVRMQPGESADDVFDLNDFFDSSASATIDFTKDGQAVDGSMVSIMGSAEAGMSTVSFEASAGGETVSEDSVVQVNSFMIDNVPGIDNNNRLAGVDGGNAFLNGIAPGSSVASAEALALVGGDDFSSLTGDSETAAASLIATIAEIETSYSETGLVVRNASVVAQGDGTASYEGLTATVDGDGSYTLEAGDDFSGAYIVTLGATNGISADAVHVLAASAQEIEMVAGNFGTPMAPTEGNIPAGEITFANGVATASLDAGEGVLVLPGQTLYETGEYATLSFNYETSATAGVSIAAIGFDGAFAGNTIAYSIVGGDLLEANATKNMNFTMKVRGGGILPGFQVVNGGGSAVTVTISDMAVIDARPLADYAINPNAEATLSVAGDLSDLAGLGSDPQGNGATAGTAVTDNNFASANGAGAVQFSSSAATPSNGVLFASELGDGSYVGECWVKKVAGPAGSAFYFVITDAGNNQARTVVDVAQLGDGWEKVIASGFNMGELQKFVVPQAAGGAEVIVDDISVRLVEDSEMFFDYELLGL